MTAEADRRPVGPNRDGRADGASATDERRRAALRQLGKAAAYGVPVTLSLMSVRRAAADS